MSYLSTYLDATETAWARKMHRDGFGTWTISATLRCTVLAVEWALIVNETIPVTRTSEEL